MTAIKEFSKDAFIQKSRETATEGIILLRNEGNMLPFREDDTVSVFGRPQIEYYRSGTGSGGSVRTPYTTNIIDGFRRNNININEDLYQDYVEWIGNNPFDNGGGGWAAEPWYQQDMLITLPYAREQGKKSNKAVYVIGRTAGEDKDNGAFPGSFELTTDEINNLKDITAVFDEVCVVLNTTNIIDMSWIDSYRFNGHIKAIVMVWAGGMEGGNAVGDILSGAVTPSGKLPDTIAGSIEDYPSTKNFGDAIKNYYSEDIYVGYRYFETFAPDKVVYEFGYGLSYTEFDIEVTDTSEKKGIISLSAKVTNKGNKYSGKEVVQVYYSAPQGKLGKPARELIAFKKTKTLAPGESEVLDFEIAVKDMASYDDSGVTGHKSCYVLESGNYHIYVGNSVRNCSEVYVHNIRSIKVTQKLSEVMCPNDDALRILRPGAKQENGTYEQIYVKSQKPTENLKARIEHNLPDTMPITGDKGIKLQDVRDGKASLEDFVAQLSVGEMAQLVRGEGMSNARVTKGTASAFGGLSDELFAYGIPAACAADGPSGLRMDGEVVSLPIGTNISSSWNVDLARELYTYEGMEIRMNQVDCILGPGVNIHRNPLNGRNFEYYSEDPYLSGRMAVACTGGIKDGGSWGTIKHFALNNQEAHRHRIDAVCSERAIREIYLKSFEMAVKEGTVMSLMSAYNPINGHWAASNYDLCTTVLREEWGYDGIVMTDWWAKMNDVVTKGSESNKRTRDMIRSQNDIYMVVNNNGAEINANDDDTEEAVIDGRLTVGELQRAAMNICRFILNAVVIERELKDTNTAEYFKSLPFGSEKYRQHRLSESDKVTFEGEKHVTMVVDEEGEFTIIVNIAFDESNLAQSTVNVKVDVGTMTVIQTHGTEGRYIRQKLGKVKLDKGVYNLELEDVLAGIKVDYIQFKRNEK